MKTPPTVGRIIALGLAGCGLCLQTHADPGVPTRNLNPVLQPILLPAYLAPVETPGWHIDHSLYVSNHFQLQDSGPESLVIDGENYRYELGINYQWERWSLHARVPFAASQGGALDGLIEGWHDAFGLPNGERETVARDELRLDYRIDDVVQFAATESGGGVGDLSLILGYRPGEKIGYFVGIELPTGSADDFTGNDGVDIAAWITGTTELSARSTLYGQLGLALPADDGLFEGLVVDEVWTAQAGIDYQFTQRFSGFAQLDAHSKTVSGSALRAFGNTLQLQLGVGIDNWIDGQRVELFFSEDVEAGTAPDISFGFRLVQRR